MPQSSFLTMGTITASAIVRTGLRHDVVLKEGCMEKANIGCEVHDSFDSVPYVFSLPSSSFFPSSSPRGPPWAALPFYYGKESITT
jgi:hypothetical protein